MGNKGLLVLYFNVISTDRYFLLIAVPLFVFMAGMLERSGVAEDLYRGIQLWIGGLAGGLAIGTVVISTVFAAMVGLSSAAVLTIGIIALPAMLKRGYNKLIAIGSISAGGALGILIPPSVVMVVYATEGGAIDPESAVSIGRLFLAGIIPGLLLAALFIVYIGLRCYFQPYLGPPVLAEEQPRWREKFNSLKSLILPVLLVVMVLGSVLGGITTPSEAAAVGAAGAILSAAIYRRLTWQNFKEASYMTLKLTSMIMWILLAGRCFRALYFASGAYQLLRDTLTTLPFGAWGIIIVMQVILLFLGCFLDPFAISILALHIFVPIVMSLGFNLVWFGILFIVNMEMAYLTPPVGLNIFYMKGIVPEGTTMGDIYRSVVPFVLIQALVLVLIMVFPQLALWLPGQLIK
jgi:tripartite ATP-independent transporter DctM subunit